MSVGGLDLQTIIWGVMALLIAGSAVFWARQRAVETSAGGPGVLLSIVLWIGIIALLVLLVQGAEFWMRLAEFFS